MDLDKYKDMLDMYTTRKRMLIKGLIVSNGKMLDVERRLEQLHVEIERRGQQTDRIEDNTNWLSKFIGNLFKYGGGAAEKKYPSRKK